MLEELHKLYKHHTTHIKDLCQRKENLTKQNHKNSTKFEIGQPIMVKYHTHYTVKP